MTDAIVRIDELLATGRYQLTGVRELPHEIGPGTTWVALVEAVVEDPDDTTECVYVELRTPEEQHWARAKLGDTVNGGERD